MSKSKYLIEATPPEDKKKEARGGCFQRTHFVWALGLILTLIFRWWLPSINTPPDKVSHLAHDIDRAAFVDLIEFITQQGALAKYRLWSTLLRKPTFMEKNLIQRAILKDIFHNQQCWRGESAEHRIIQSGKSLNGEIVSSQFPQFPRKSWRTGSGFPLQIPV